MRSVIILLTTSLLAPSAIAIPNIWSSGFGQGISVYNITNEQGDTFHISCDGGYSEHGDATGATFTLANGQEISPSNQQGGRKVELLIDGQGYWLPGELGWRGGDNAWAEFLAVITKAGSFDVYVDDKKMAQFSPTVKSTQAVLGDMSDCVYRY